MDMDRTKKALLAEARMAMAQLVLVKERMSRKSRHGQN
jgi:hypothetical protein